MMTILLLGYLYLPVMIFLAGWVKTWIAVPIILILLCLLFKMYRAYASENIAGGEKKSETYAGKVSVPAFILISLFLAGFCIILGFDGTFLQAGDWYKHNAVLRDLMTKEWPVYYTQKEHTMLVYYIGQYLFPALIGKIAGSFRIAQIAMALWGIIGVLLTYWNLIRILHADTLKKQVKTLLVFLFFCGALPLAQIAVSKIYPSEAGEIGNYHWLLVSGFMMQYRSSTVLLRWVFPQCIVPWICAELFLEHKEKMEYYVLLLLPTLLFGSFSFIGFVFMAVITLGYQLIHKKCVKRIVRQCFSLTNIIPLITLGSVFFFYFWGNISTQKPEYLGFQMQHFGMKYLPVYLIFCFFMFGIYALCVWKENRKNPVFLSAVLLLALIPFFKMGLYNDFVMCVSIPALFLLEIFVTDFLMKHTKDGNEGIRKGILILCLCIGAWYPLCETAENISAKQPGNMSADGYSTLTYFADRDNPDIPDDLKYNYYAYELDQNFFYRNLARKKITE